MGFESVCLGECVCMDTLSLIKEARIYSGEKTASSVSGAGKTGQLHVKE